MLLAPRSRALRVALPPPTGGGACGPAESVPRPPPNTPARGIKQHAARHP
ncbi:hypothetical protein APY03_1721 [Variovorax sp. WDL1]|nr:hypothetical protein APY03_1721 [Variovorax sp. WDL1]